MVLKAVTPAAAPLRIVVGGDDAGYAYKSAIFADLSNDPRVSRLLDVGPFSATDTTAYPHYAVAAARKVSSIVFCLTSSIRLYLHPLHHVSPAWTHPPYLPRHNNTHLPQANQPRLTLAI